MNRRHLVTAVTVLAAAVLTTGCDKDGKKGPAQATPAAQGAPVETPAKDNTKKAEAKPAQAQAPPMGGNGAQALPPGHPPVGQQLPPGHPPTGGGMAPSPNGLPSAPAGPAGAGSTVTVMGYSIDAPKDWVREPPRSRMRVAQFRLPKAEGDPREGVCTFIVAGGDVASNVNRWRTQFKENPEAKTETVDAGGVKVTVVTIQGTFMEQARPMAGGPGTARDNTIMQALIAPMGDRSLFVKAWGPAPTMKKYAEGFVAMAKSLRKGK